MNACIHNQQTIRRFALATDFSDRGSYIGQMQLLLAEQFPQHPVINLIADLPRFRPDLAAYFLAAIVRQLPAGTLYLCVVDPGVGSERRLLALEANGCWFLAPDNGLLSIIGQDAHQASWWQIDWQPPVSSVSFHGRDFFVPVAANLAKNKPIAGHLCQPNSIIGADWPTETARILYCDDFGNLITGFDGYKADTSRNLLIKGQSIGYARTFSEVAIGQLFWYCNSFGLVEIAANQTAASMLLSLEPGDVIQWSVNDP